MTPSPYAGAARRAAASILSQPPFTAPRSRPNALDRASSGIGRVLGDVGHFFSHLFSSAAHPVARGTHALLGPYEHPVLIAVTILAAALVAAVAVRRARRRSRPGDEDGHDAARPGRAPRAPGLLRRAAAARDAGDLDHALRLRFEAGLEDLEDRGLLVERATLTTTQVGDTLASPRFDGLAATHTLVAYAGVAATRGDVDAAFETWPEVPSDVGGARAASTAVA